MATDRSTLFLTTRWTLVSEAARTGDTRAQAALGELFGLYWKPLYRYARRQGQSPVNAEDLVQGFFAHLLEGGGLRLADRDRGRFRAFMLGALRHFMANEWRRQHRQKRGGFAPRGFGPGDLAGHRPFIPGQPEDPPPFALHRPPAPPPRPRTRPQG